MKRPPMLESIAKELGLAPATVSMCLSGSAQKYRIKQETIDRVRAYAASVGYVPSRTARNLAVKTEAPTGLLLYEYGYAEVRVYAYQEVVRRLRRAGREYVVHHFITGHLAEAIAQFKGYGVRDVIVLAALDSEYTENHENMSELLAVSQNMTLHLTDHSQAHPWLSVGFSLFLQSREVAPRLA